MPSVKHRDVLDSEESDTLAALKLRSTSMPDHRTPLERRTLSTGLSMPDPHRLPVLGEHSGIEAQPPLILGGTELQRAVSRAKPKLSQKLEAATIASLTDIKLQRLQRYIVDTRMKLMPHQNSRVDRYLKKAEFFAKCVSKLSVAVGKSDHHADEAARLIWRCVEVVLVSIPLDVTHCLLTAFSRASSTPLFSRGSLRRLMRQTRSFPTWAKIASLMAAPPRSRRSSSGLSRLFSNFAWRSQFA